MTDTIEIADASSRPSRGLSGLNVAELKGMASGLGITGTGRMRKDELVAAIAARRSGGSSEPHRGQPPSSGAPSTTQAPTERPERAGEPVSSGPPAQAPGSNGHGESAATGTQADRAGAPAHRGHHGPGREQPGQTRADQGQAGHALAGPGQPGQGQSSQGQAGHTPAGPGQPSQGQPSQGQPSQAFSQPGQAHGHAGQSARYEDDGDARPGRRRSRQRSRDRKRGRGQGGYGQGGLGGDYQQEQDVQISEDDVLVPVAGILDVLDNYAFVRTSGYLPGPNDVYVPLGMVKRNGLRKGDAVTGAVRALREGEAPTAQGGNRAKFNALVRLDTVNGMTPEQAKARVEFTKLTPLYPQDRLRLETASNGITTRVIDLVSPIGKGQRGLIVSPPKAGKTLILQAVANAITTNNPEVHLMVVLVDERPEEVTDMQRTVRGEVIASTFDRPADDHTTVAELAIERAKRLVELGQDVVVLLDGITRLGRAYNLAAPASGRILSGGVDSAALYPPKRFFGAARNIENGGSLTILATALVETGSKMDEVIFEEFKGTGNWELKLSRQLANRRIFPAVDVNASGTRREDILMSPEELKIMWKLRRVLSALDETQGIELLLAKLRNTKSNVEFLVQVQRTSSIKLDDEDDD
ncbi:MAG: transcription termination factor Rho [Dermatophilaceae bacterium]